MFKIQTTGWEQWLNLPMRSWEWLLRGIANVAVRKWFLIHCRCSQDIKNLFLASLTVLSASRSARQNTSTRRHQTTCSAGALWQQDAEVGLSDVEHICRTPWKQFYWTACNKCVNNCEYTQPRYSLDTNGQNFDDAWSIVFLCFVNAMEVKGVAKKPAPMQFHPGFLKLWPKIKSLVLKLFEGHWNWDWGIDEINSTEAGNEWFWNDELKHSMKWIILKLLRIETERQWNKWFWKQALQQIKAGHVALAVRRPLERGTWNLACSIPSSQHTQTSPSLL